jgi:hypothetical protein
MTLEQKNQLPLTRKLNAHEKKMLRYSASVCRQNLQPYCNTPLEWDTHSVAFLSSFIDHQRLSGYYLCNGVTVAMAGAYLGECIISRYSGKWVRFSTGSLQVQVSSLFLVDPAFMVQSHLQMLGEKTVYGHYLWIGETLEQQKHKWVE